MQLLDPSALIEQLAKLLPADSSIETPHDAIAILTHATLTRLGFRLISLSDTAGTVNVEKYEDNVLSLAWNRTGPSSYSFRYAHEQSSMTFLVKIVSLSARVLIHATTLESSRTESYEIELDRFTSRNYWPWTKETSSEPLVNGFVSSTRIADFVFGLQVKIVQKLIPGLRKEGYEEVHEQDQGSSSTGPSNPSTQPEPQRPLRPEPRADDYLPPFRNPLRVGDRDLDPLAGSPFGGFTGPPPLFGGDDGGGMYVGPNHPMFRDRQPGAPERPLPGGGIVPPGARYDPVSPFARPNPPFAAPRRPHMGDPDWDEMPPPGNNVSAFHFSSSHTNTSAE